jgi:23S rRNA (guanine2445-N2)-methyltransferase / 23S rRNA (guanine2069-N7)-methyltransferase
VGGVPLRFMATAPRGLADLVGRELREFGVESLRERTGGVLFEGTLAQGYRACLWSRVASRVLLEVAAFQAASDAEFHAATRAVDWRTHLAPGATLACEFTGKHPVITHSHYGALRLKDGICDQLRDVTGARPDIDADAPDVRVVAHASGARITLYVDLAGEALNRRGYRLNKGEAPLRENLAAGILLRAGWPALAAAGGAFLDPMCGSGTLVIEAALVAADRAPGLARARWGFERWAGHDAVAWAALRDEAHARARPDAGVAIAGSDVDGAVLRAATGNAERAGVASLVQFRQCAVRDARPPAAGGSAAERGLVATNPPYGERMGDPRQALIAHRELGETLRAHFPGWQAAILTAAPEAARALSLRSYRTHELWNGALECRLLRIDLDDPGAPAREDGAMPDADAALAASPGAVMFANRLVKNIKALARPAAKEQASCYRLYDADMPEYALAIDRYAERGTGDVHLYVQEYAAPSTIDPQAARRRRAEALATLPAATGVARGHIHLRVRQRQRGASQYEQLARERATFLVEEDGLPLELNFSDYLDTGLFLDHRLVRRRIRAAAAGKRFLNLFCYTATATLHAAAGSAAHTLSVDMSATYLDWAARNFALNGLGREQHELLQADCLAFIAEARPAQWDLVFLDPPTFSNSKRMEGVLDTQRDHAGMIGQCMRLLAPGGLLVFSTNAQRFKLDEVVAERWQVADVSAQSIPFDFARNPRIHRCFEIRAR